MPPSAGRPRALTDGPRWLGFTSALLAVVTLAGCDGLMWLLEPEPTAPAAPIIAPVETPTARTVVSIAGSKPAGTAVELDEQPFAELDGETSFNGELALAPGLVEYSFTTLDAAGRRSPATVITVDRDDVAPASPVLEEVVAFVTTATVAVSGTREAGTSIWLNGAELVPLGEATTWTGAAELAFGDNRLRFAAQDRVGNESPIVEIHVYRGEFGFIVDPVPELVAGLSITVSGDRAPFVAIEVNDVAVAAADATGGPWSTDVVLTEGSNQLVVAGIVDGARDEAFFTVVADSTAPAPPTLDPTPNIVTTSTLTLSGTLPELSYLVVGGQRRSSLTEGAVSATVDLPQGLTQLEVRAEDEAGNFSSPIEPPPTVYFNPSGLVFDLDPWPPLVAVSPLVVSGSRGGDVDVYVGGLLAAAADGSTSFSVDVGLVAGMNAITVEGRVGAVSSLETVTVVLDTTAPLAPILDDTVVVAVNGSAVITGSHEMGSVLLRGGVMVSPIAGGPFVDVVAVPVVPLTLQYAARDALGRLSPTVNVTVVAEAPDGGQLDAGVLDAGVLDAGVLDAGVFDGGPLDAGPLDAGPLDAGPGDAGPGDAGPLDAGPGDAGPGDAGPLDAGPGDAG